MSKPTLPFSLRDGAVLDIISLLGISLSDLDYLPLQHFMKTESNEALAKQAHESYLAKRSALIKQIQEQRRELRAESAPPPPGAEVLHEKVRLTHDERQLAERQTTNKLILRRLAILQLREANALTSCSSINSKVDELSQAHKDHLHEQLAEAQTAVDGRTFAPAKREMTKNLGDCLFQTVAQTRLLVDHERNWRARSQARAEHLEEQAAATTAKIAEVQERHSASVQKLLNQRQKRVEKTEYRGSLIPEKIAERNKRLEERAAEREERKKTVIQNNDRLLKGECERVKKSLDGKAERAQAVQDSHRAEVAQRIEVEKKAMEKRLAAARRTFQEKDEKLKEYERMFRQRDATIEQNRAVKETEISEKLAAERFELDQKIAAMQRARGLTELKAATTLRQKLVRSSLGIDDVKRQRARA
jgi:hypothetical protein